MEGGVNPITKLSGDGNQDHRSGAVRSWLCIRASEPDSSDGGLRGIIYAEVAVRRQNPIFSPGMWKGFNLIGSR
jgi:hypothetical protein